MMFLRKGKKKGLRNTLMSRLSLAERILGVVIVTGLLIYINDDII